jgi:hypothetical protein
MLGLTYLQGFFVIFALPWLLAFLLTLKGRESMAPGASYFLVLCGSACGCSSGFLPIAMIHTLLQTPRLPGRLFGNLAICHSSSHATGRRRRKQRHRASANVRQISNPGARMRLGVSKGKQGRAGLGLLCSEI